MPDSPVSLIYDASGQPVSVSYAPVTSRPGQALYTAAGQAAQGGLVALGSDYASGGAKAQVPKIDASGAQYVVPSDATQAGVAVASLAAVTGNVALGLNGLVPTALAVDAMGNLAAAQAVLPTFTAVATAVSLANGKSCLALQNKSAGSVVRILGVYAQNTGTNPSTLTSYSIYAQQMHHIAAFTNGTSVACQAFDTADALPSGITCATGATVSGEASPPIRRWITSGYPLAPGGTAAENTTADQQGRDPWATRTDPSSKLVTVRPGAGVHLKIATAATNGFVDVTFVFTVSAS